MQMSALPVEQAKEYGNTKTLVHAGLLWKEWKQHQYVFCLFFLLLFLEPLGSPAIAQAFSPQLGIMHGPGYNPWITTINGIIQTGVSYMEFIGIIAVVFLAAIMVAGERGKGLNFLVTAPVSRRQILLAKWLTGNLTILITMVLLFIYMVILHALYPADLAMNELTSWAGRTTALLLCLFSLAIFSACLCTGVLYSAMMTAFFLMLPFLSNIILIPVNKYALLSSHQVKQIFEWLGYFNIIVFVWNGENVYPLLLTIPLLLIASLLFLILAIRAFENNPLERSGEVLLSGNFKKMGRWLMVYLFAPPFAAELADTMGWFILYTVLIAIGIYLGLGLLWRIMGRLDLSKQPD